MKFCVPAFRAIRFQRKAFASYIKGLFFFALAVSAIHAQAQTLPDAGVLRQQIEREEKPALPMPGLLPKPAPAPLKELTGAMLVVKTFRFSGNQKLSEEALQAVVASYTNRPLDFAQLQDATAAVGKAYRDAGWVVRVYLPQQEIEDGIVSIEVVEAVFGSLRFDGKPSLRLPESLVQRYVDQVQKPGEPLYSPAIDRAILLLGDLPGVAVTGDLREGPNSGQTDLAFKVQDKPLFSADAAVDNTGSPSTGINHLSVGMNFNSPLGRRDLFSANLMLSEGSRYGRVALSLPLGYAGWRVSANGSYMAFTVITPALRSLNIQGMSTSYGLDASYPLLRSRLDNLYLALGYERKDFFNEANLATSSQYAITAGSVALNSNHVDQFWGGGINSFGLTLRHGSVNLNGSPNQKTDAATTATDGHFEKIAYSVNRLQALTQTMLVYASFTGQATHNNLDSGEKFYLGGVRAYPASEAGGGNGKLASLELRARLPQGFDLTGFYDWGKVTVNRNNSFFGAAAPNHLSLQGFGITAGWSRSGINLKATLARRIGRNPNPTATGTDQDGTLHINRLWLQAALQL